MNKVINNNLGRKLLSAFIMAAVLITAITANVSFADTAGITADASVTFSVPSPNDDFYIYDETGTVTEDDKQFIVDWGNYLDSNYGAQPVVVIVNSASPDVVDIETYTDQMMRAWKVGGDSGLGIMLVMDVTADDYWCVAGDALKSHFTSSAIQTILDEQVDTPFSEKDYSTAAKNLINTVANDLNTYLPTSGLTTTDAQTSTDTAGTAPSETTVDAPSSSSGGMSGILKVLLIVILVLVIVFCIIFIAVYMHGQKIKRQREEQRRRREAQARRSVQQRGSNDINSVRAVRTQPRTAPTRASQPRTVPTRTASAAPNAQPRRRADDSDTYSDIINSYSRK